MMPDTLYCNFCGKSQHYVAKLIAGPTVYICNECTDLCFQICHPSSDPPKTSIEALRDKIRMVQQGLGEVAKSLIKLSSELGDLGDKLPRSDFSAQSIGFGEAPTDVLPKKEE